MAARLVVVGGGRMGGALVTGLIERAGWPADQVAVVEPDQDRRDTLVTAHPGLVVEGGTAIPLPGADGGAVLAVKPDVAEPVCRALGRVGVARVLSVVAGMPTHRLEASLPDGTTVVRAMPNMGALVGAGVSAMSGGSRAQAADLDWAESVLSGVGAVVRVPERHLDAVTGLSGSGPAYVFLMAEALIEAGVAVGLSRDLSRTLVVETVRGAALLMAGSADGPEVLRAAITSPGGTTAAGLRALEARAVRSAFLEAVLAATERSRNLTR